MRGIKEIRLTVTEPVHKAIVKAARKAGFDKAKGGTRAYILRAVTNEMKKV